MTNIRGAILAGGGARRFGGGPKGLAIVGGERILDRLVRTLEEATGVAPLLVANAEDATSWRPDLTVVPDVMPGTGALGGILTAVLEAPAPVVLVAWDMPFVPPGLLRRLADGLKEADVVIPESPGRRGVEPLCAAYGPACAEPIRRCLDSGDRRAIAFHDQVEVHRLPMAAIREFGEPSRIFFNVNTPGDLERAEEC